MQYSYWMIKKNNFDCVLLFRKGKVFEAHYEDAVKVKNLCGLAFFGDKMMVSFNSSMIHRNIGYLVNAGHKVAIVDNASADPDNSDDDMALESGKSKKSHQNDTGKKFITHIYTKTTFQNEEEMGYENRYLWSIYCFSEEEITRARKAGDKEIETFESADDKDKKVYLNSGISFTIAEMTVGQVVTGFMFGDVYSKLTNLMHIYPPCEVIYNPKRVDKEIVNSIEKSVWAPKMLKFSSKKKNNSLWSSMNIFEDVMGMFQLKNRKSLIQEFKEVLNQFGDGKFTLSKSLGGLFNFLYAIKNVESLIDNFNLQFFDESTTGGKNMIIDSTTLENLEILEHHHHDANKGNICLFNNLNRCSSNPGKRLLRKWVASPLLDPVQIS